MIFITGGAYSGKSEYAREQFGIDSITEYNAPYEALVKARAIRGFHLFIKAAMAEGLDIYAETEKLLALNPEVIIISDEIGCGIVPADAGDIKWREATGRIHCILAKRAEKAVRVVCGIGVEL